MPSLRKPALACYRDWEKMRQPPNIVQRAAAGSVVLNSRPCISGAGRQSLYNRNILGGPGVPPRASIMSAVAFAGCTRSGAGASFPEATPCP
jgi:hypothetical protein